MQADSIVPGAANPQAFNRYTYVLNNPVNFVDPSGHYARPMMDGERCFHGHGEIAKQRVYGNLSNTDKTGGLGGIEPVEDDVEPNTGDTQGGTGFCNEKPWHSKCQGGKADDPALFGPSAEALLSSDPILYCRWEADLNDDNEVDIFEYMVCMEGVYSSAGLPLKWYQNIYPYQNPLPSSYSFDAIEDQLIVTALNVQNIRFISDLGMDETYYPNYEPAFLASLIAHYPHEYAFAKDAANYAEEGNAVEIWWENVWENLRGGGE